MLVKEPSHKRTPLHDSLSRRASECLNSDSQGMGKCVLWAREGRWRWYLTGVESAFGEMEGPGGGLHSNVNVLSCTLTHGYDLSLIHI